MRMVFGLVLIVGIALAGAAVYLAQGFISHTQAELARERAVRAKSGPLVEVYVVNKPLKYGDKLTKEDVQISYWPKNTLPEGVFSDEALLFPEGEKEPRFVLRQLEKFEPVLAVKVTEPGQAAGLTGTLEKGMRAFTIKFEGATDMTRYLQPGDSVDIYWTGATGDSGTSITQLIETSMAIIAVDRPESKKSADLPPRTITVSATPQQVARLAQGQATGSLAVSMVGRGDEAVAGGVEVDSNKLLGVTQQEVVAAEEKQVCMVRNRKGSEMVEIEIPCTN